MDNDFQNLKKTLCEPPITNQRNSLVSKLCQLVRFSILRMNNPISEASNAPHQINTIKRILGLYKTFDFKFRSANRVIAIMTESTVNAGLADRFRTMLSGYVLAAESGKSFHIHHTKGFHLEDYLVPNEIDWRINPKSIASGFNNVQFMFFLKRIKQLQKSRECHVYSGDNLIDNGFIPSSLAHKYSDHSVFNKLFKFHPNVISSANKLMQEIGITANEYVSVHLRFLNFFERVELYGNYPEGSEEEKAEMLTSIEATLEKIHKETNSEILLFSDSNTFLKSPHADYVHVLPGTVGHVVKHNGQDDVTLKAFSDLLIMSRSRAVYSIIGKNIYAPGFCSNGFSRAGAYIGNKPFIRYPRIEKMV